MNTEWNERFERLLGERHRKDNPEGCMISGWIVLAECVDADGNHWISCHRDPRTTIWGRMGMLEFALNEERLTQADLHVDEEG